MGCLPARPGRLRNLLLASALTTAVSVLIVLPVLPAADIAWTYKSNPTLGETVGWPQFVQTVDGMWKSLAPACQHVIFTADYGEAGAINELGRRTGLPTAVSGQNSEWWWGPGNPHATTVVAVAPGPIDVIGYAAYLRRFFTHVRAVATLSNPYIHNQEWGGHVYVCTGLRHPWAKLWPRLRHYD